MHPNEQTVPRSDVYRKARQGSEIWEEATHEAKEKGLPLDSDLRTFRPLFWTVVTVVTLVVWSVA